MKSFHASGNVEIGQYFVKYDCTFFLPDAFDIMTKTSPYRKNKQCYHELCPQYGMF